MNALILFAGPHHELAAIAYPERVATCAGGPSLQKPGEVFSSLHLGLGTTVATMISKHAAKSPLVYACGGQYR